MTIDTATDARPTYPGTLSVVEQRGQPPTLFLSFRCDRCRKVHHHSWGLAEDGTEDWDTRPRAPHCPGLHGPGPHRHFPAGYSVTPAPTAANRATYRRYAELLRRHDRPAATRATR